MNESAKLLLHNNNARRELCKNIVSLDESCTIEHVRSAIVPTVTRALAVEDDNDADNDVDADADTDAERQVLRAEFLKHRESAVTPLMLACDKGKIACLQYFQSLYDNQDQSERDKKALDHLLGDCLYSSQADGNNQAIHYTISSPGALEFLANILRAQRRTGGNKMGTGMDMEIQMSLDEACLVLLSQENDHADTPFMMAAAEGRKVTIETWIRIALSHGSKSNKRKEAIQEILHRTNHARDSALSLAGHGHHELVEFLTSFHERFACPLVQVTYSDIQRVDEIANKLKDIESQVPTDRLEEFKLRQQNVNRCLILLRTASARHAEEMSKLLLSESEPNQAPVLARREKKKKKKKAAIHSTRTNNQHDRATDGEHNDSVRISEENHAVQNQAVELSKPKFVTMEDGTIISDHQKVVDSPSRVNLELAMGLDQKPIELLLKERCDDTLSQQSEELMDALCLDASMLLLSPHALAMNLSPSQLEAVDTVLKNQLNAVAQAKIIHDRLMAKTIDETGISS